MSHVLHRSQPAALPSLIRLVRPAGRFGLHLFEMCMAMCVGVAVLDMPFLALATWAGYSDPIRQLPEQAAWSRRSTCQCPWPPGCAFAATTGGASERCQARCSPKRSCSLPSRG